MTIAMIAERRVLGLVAWAVCGAFAAAAHAQTLATNSAAFNAGYGRTAGSENQPVNVQQNDVSGALLVQNGLVQTGASGGLFASLGGALDVATGVGGQASTIGPNLSVVTPGGDDGVAGTAAQTGAVAVTTTTTTAASTHGKP
jgi:holdfast attachment protein HfaA